MVSEFEHEFGRIAVDNRYLTESQVSSALSYKEKSAPTSTLADILVDQGCLTVEEREEIIRQIPSTQPLFGAILSRLGLVTEAQVEEALQVKQTLASRNIHRFLGEILVEKHVISEDQIREVLKAQGKVHLQCDACGYRFNTLHRVGYACPECGRRLGSADVAGAAVTAPGLRFDEFTLKEPIVAGPGWKLYRAGHPALTRDVALKVMPDHAINRPFLKIFHDHARHALEISHPNIATLIEVGMHRGALFIATEFVKGLSLYDYVQSKGRLSVQDAIPLMRQIAAGLAAAHDRGLLHGNLKPHNVLVTDRGVVKLTDFGLNRGATGEGSGWPHFLAPEQIHKAAVPASDLFACGVLWHFMLTGTPPAPDMAARGIAPRKAELPPEAQKLFLGLIHPDPESRIKDPITLISDLYLLEEALPEAKSLH